MTKNEKRTNTFRTPCLPIWPVLRNPSPPRLTEFEDKIVRYKYRRLAFQLEEHRYLNVHFSSRHATFSPRLYALLPKVSRSTSRTCLLLSSGARERRRTPMRSTALSLLCHCYYCCRVLPDARWVVAAVAVPTKHVSGPTPWAPGGGVQQVVEDHA